MREEDKGREKGKEKRETGQRKKKRQEREEREDVERQPFIIIGKEKDGEG